MLHEQAAAAPSAAARPPQERVAWPKTLLVMAHPDDEYVAAATTFRISRELGGITDHVVITNGAGGYRYALLAETIYGVAIAREADGRANLPAIRKQETMNAGRILGTRRQYFLDQPDDGFTNTCAEAQCGQWDPVRIDAALTGLLASESYDFVLILLPREQEHGHHRAAALFILRAVETLPPESRPVVLGAEVGRADEEPAGFTGLADDAITRTAQDAPVFSFNRNVRFGQQGALNYQIVANWVIAEHKSQGLFQTDYGKHDVERFWAFALTPRAVERAQELGRLLLRPAASIDSVFPTL
jgi:LmbE family N-acetylglucosaminyl deacetylase